MKDPNCAACQAGVANPISHQAGCRYGDDYRRGHEAVEAEGDKVRASQTAAREASKAVQRTLDISYILQGQDIDGATLDLLKAVWDRAYVMGQWRGMDTLKANLEAAVGQTLSEGPR
jgi:hypothetical protein